jgi:putative redox protein
MKVSTSYQGNMRFASGEGAAKVVMDAKPEVGGQGEALTPKEMVLQGLVGCTGMDVAAVLTKKGVRFDDLTIEAEATQTRTSPKVFDSIQMVFHVKAAEEDRDQVEKAIKMSQKLFCGVSEMLRKTATLEWTLDLQPL